MSVTSLQCAILSMDVYNRNYSEGDNPPPLSLGASEILDDEVSILQEMPVAGSSFYAAAYAVGGTIVIAFRGTDDSDDQSTGWGLGGWPWGVASVPEQARLAAKFVREIRDDPDYAGMDIVLTGHSLGGGLAGFCATLFDLQAHCFNTMSWQDGAEKARADALYADYLEENDEEVPADLADLRARVYGVGEIPPLMPVETVGGVVGAGEVLMQIVPSGRSVFVEARVSPMDIDRVVSSQDVTLKFPGLNSRTTSDIRATVSTVPAATSWSNSETMAPYYAVQIDIPDPEMSRLPPGTQLMPGMPVEAYIETGTRTVADYLLRPILDSFSSAFRDD